jgi:hypothetical protein
VHVKPRLILALTAVCAVALTIALAIAPSGSAQRANAAVPGLSQQGMSNSEKRHLSGFASFEAGIGVPAHAAAARPSARTSGAAGGGAGGGVSLCPRDFGPNVLVNQNCLNISDPNLQGRGQAQNETAIAQNPLNPRQMVAGFNDYRRGDSTCGTAFSGNGGSSWTDSTLPNGFTSGANFGGVARQYWQGSGDPSVAWDSRGNAYYACQVFTRGPGVTNNPDLSSAVYVFRSTGDAGASWNFTGHAAVETLNSTPGVLTDKPYMTIDNNPSSPFRDRIYLTWTQFAADGSAYIYEVSSSDYGQTFSSPVVVSTTSPLCTHPSGGGTPQGPCNNNQFSDPFTGPDGTLYVAFANYNNTVTGQDNRSQVLLTKSADGGATFSAPVKVADYYELPDCLAAQGSDAFSACVPEKGTATNSVFRAANYPSGGVNPADPSQVVVTVGSYINRDSNESNGCTPNGLSATTGGNLYIGTKTAGACSNKIMLSVSGDAGASFTGSTTDPRLLPVVSTARGQATADQWFQWAAFTPRGTLATSYYDRAYGSDETTGNMDISVSTSGDLSRFKVTRATSASMPLPTQFPDANGNSLFFGDYTGLSALSGANPIWSDTRNPDAFLCAGTGTSSAPPAVCTAAEPNGLLANDQQIYTRMTPAS